jgi:Uma2 family endonuclease
MEETIVRPDAPTSRPPRTIMEVFKMLPETTLAEVIENTLYMSPAPIGKHQRAISKLLTRISTFVDDNHLGEAFVAPLDVYLDEASNAVQPDIFFVAANHLDIVDNEGSVHGVPDLIIEILSTGNFKYDLETKKELYEKFGVQEYWIVNPTTKLVIGYSLTDNQYGMPIETTSNIPSKLLNHTFDF